MTDVVGEQDLEPRLSEPAFRSLNTAEVLSRRDRVIRSLHLGAYRSGLSTVASRFNKTATASILMYHSVPDPDEVPWMDPANCLSPATFERQMAFLARHRHVISLSSLVTMLEEGEPFAPGTVVVTFDDGYLNNLTVAAPILARHGVPATLYLNTGSIETGDNQWVDQLYSAFRTRTVNHLDLTDFHRGPTESNGDIGPWDLGDPDTDRAAYHATCGLLINADANRRDSALESAIRQLAPAATPPRLTMNWDDVRTMLADHPNITLGVHSTNHIDLRQHPNSIDAEARSCINQFERNTGRTPEHFAFPYNRHDETSEAAIARFFRSSVGENPDDPVVRPGATAHGLQRLAAPASMTLLRSFTDGGYPNVTQRLFKKVWHKPY